MINNIYFDKSSYKGNKEVFLCVENIEKHTPCSIEVFHLDKIIRDLTFELTPGFNKIGIGVYEDKLAGYFVVFKLRDKIQRCAFSVDPNNSIIRYGFLSDFEKADNNEDIKWMNLNHLNYIQFYDWSYRHDNMIPPSTNFEDMMGKKNNLDVIKQKIDCCNKFGMKTMAYGPIYAASKEYFMSHKEDGYYAREGVPLTFIEVFYFMSISDNSSWKRHIINEYRQSIDKLGFSGIHLDTYGYPKRALDSFNNVKDLENDIPIFLNDVSSKLDKASFIFNNVGAWPLKKMDNRNLVATYIEVWPPYETYYHLKQLINKAKEAKKPVILAAYISSFKTDRKRAFYNALITTFYINSLGATHLFLGEEGAVITQGYYSDYSLLSENEVKGVQTYTDFFVRYQEILYDKSLKDVTMTHCGWDNEEYVIKGNYSLTAQPNKISVSIRANIYKHLFSFVNLENNDEMWNLGKDEPALSSNLEVKAQIFKDVDKVFFASPDFPSISELEFTVEEGNRSSTIKFQLPSIKVGAIVWFEER